MFCHRCGGSMPDTANACPQCGAAVQQTSQTAGQSPAPVVAPASASPQNPPRFEPYRGAQETDGKAIGSLILGILAMFPLGLIAGIPAVVLGHLSRKSIRESRGRLKGDGMALAGLIMGYLSVAVLPIILIIAAIAIPSLIRSRIGANQSMAMSAIRTINTSQTIYQTNFNAGYARDLATLGPGPSGRCVGQGSQEHACLLEGALGNSACTSGSWCVKYGYKFSITGVCGDQSCSDFVVVATPVAPGTSGTRSYCSTADAVIRFHRGGEVPTTVEECLVWSPVE
jgi:type IV pilus assembly protein PilA